MRTRPAWPSVVSPWSLTGAVVGLFLVRVALEAAQRSWPGGLIVVLASLAALFGFALFAWLAHRRRPSATGPTPHSQLPTSRTVSPLRLWPALLLLVYVLWPRRDPAVAASVAVLAGLVWLLGRASPSLPRWAEPLADGATFVAAFVAYVATAAPDVLPADFGEFQMVATLLGVAHPPGYPLYTLIGHLFIRLLPWGTPAYRLNLMSGVLAAGALVLVARATRLWARRLDASPAVAIISGLAAALTLGTATTFWAQATIASIRIPTALFTALALYALSCFTTAASPREADRALTLLGLAFGLGFGHHLSLAFPGSVFVLYVVLTDPRLVVQPRRWWRPLLACLVGLLPLIYLPIRGAMGAVQAPPGLATWQGFLHHFLARGWAGDMFAFANAEDLPHRLSLLPTLSLFQFNFLLLAAALLGLLGLLLRRDWRLFVMLAGSLALQTFVAITYRAPQTVEYLMPAYLPFAVAVGLFPALLSGYRPASSGPRPAPCLSRLALATSRRLPEVSSALAAAVLWAGLLNGWTHAPSFAALAGDYTARQAAEPLLETAPAGARILADWRWVTPLRYLQRVEELRLDEVEVAEVYPVAEEEYRDTWMRRIQETEPGQPLLLTHFYEFPGYTTEPWEAGFLIRPRPVTEPVASLTPVAATFGGQVRLLGYSLRQSEFPASPPGATGPFHPGQAVEFVLAWQAAGPLDPPPSFTLRLVDAQGRHVAQVDRALSTDVARGEVRFVRLVLALYPNLPPGRYQVVLGVYTVTGAGFETLSSAEGETAVHLTDLELVPRGCGLQSTACNPRSAPFTLHQLAVPFAGGPNLVGVDYDRSVPDVLRIYLHWRGPANGGEQARVQTADGVEVDASLPPIPAGAYQTVLMDLRGPVSAPLRLVLADAQGGHRSAAGAWAWSVRQVRLPAPSPDARFVPLGDEMVVIGAEARPTGPGDELAVDVTLIAQRPLAVDDSTSVRLMDGEGRWLASHDYQPALGAVPTLKWIRGSRVVDRHLFSLPEDFTGGEVQATLLVYERFRLASLPSMDGRFTEVPLGTWTLP